MQVFILKWTFADFLRIILNHITLFKNILVLILIWIYSCPTMIAQTIDQNRGIDPDVDYNSLKQYGAWDDRNYSLTSEDLKALSPNEADLKDIIPAFYRVELRNRYPELLKTGPAQYPRSALQYFRMEYQGFSIDGDYYRKIRRLDEGYEVIVSEDSKLPKSKSNLKMSQTEHRVSNPEGAAESAIKIHPFDPNIVIAGSNGPGFGQKMHYSHDGGMSWTEVSLPLGGTCCDPTIDYSSDGAFAYTATLGNGVYFYRSSDDGVSWTDLENETPGDPRREFGVGFSDKEFIHVDKHCTSPYKDNIYVTWHEGNTMQFIRSTDFGNTWDPKISFNADPSGIGSDIVTDRDGSIYYAYPATSLGQILLKKSTNGGTSFATGTTLISDTEGNFDFAIPAMDTRRVFIYVSLDADLSNGPYGGSIYAAWTDSTAPEQGNPANNHSRIQVGYSRDQGSTWTVVTPHSTSDMNSVDRFHQWLAVGLDGTVHVVFYDTRNSVGRTGVDFYHSFSTDGAQTFSEPERLTSITSPKINDGFEWGDYNGLDHVVRRSTIFTDNRDEDNSGGDSQDIYSTTVLQGGTNYSMAPNKPSSILGPTIVCVGQDDLPFEVPFTSGADEFEWSFSDGSASIAGNGDDQITLNGVGAGGGTLSVFARNICGQSAVETLNISIASNATCDVVNCVLNNLSIDDPTLATSEIFDIIQTIDSDASVQSGEFKSFRAGSTIELEAGFTVEKNAIFISQIEDCQN